MGRKEKQMERKEGGEGKTGGAHTTGHTAKAQANHREETGKHSQDTGRTQPGQSQARARPQAEQRQNTASMQAEQLQKAAERLTVLSQGFVLLC